MSLHPIPQSPQGVTTPVIPVSRPSFLLHLQFVPLPWGALPHPTLFMWKCLPLLSLRVPQQDVIPQRSCNLPGQHFPVRGAGNDSSCAVGTGAIPHTEPQVSSGLCPASSSSHPGHPAGLLRSLSPAPGGDWGQKVLYWDLPMCTGQDPG